jgi:DNA-binding transcriptional ArsR family regulator/uncharacterized protein YndB with AHSA1/START domain
MEAVLRALADESRRTMLETLTGGPATAGELAALLPIARPGVSRHLRVLREAGLVEVRQEAQRRVYSLRPQPLAEIDEWLGRYRALWEQRLDALHTEIARGKTRTKEHQMTGNARPGTRILGSLRSADGKGVVRIEDRYDTDIDDLWSALTDPLRLARWMGVVEGDLRLGGEFRARFFSSGWEGTGHVEACEPPRRLLLLTMQPGQQGEHVIEVTLAADGDQTILAWEERGMPLDHLAAYGAGIQVHVEDLTAHLAGRERCDAEARWAELLPAYQDLAASVG